MKKQYSHAVCYTYKYAYTYFGIYTKQNERHIVSIPSREIGDFDIKDKAKNAFLSIPAISPAGWDKDTFFFYNATLYENIISSNIRKIL